ncbi:MAG: SpoIIE family protein phosphatase [Thermoguttaceae bacterium]|nr:SpoIIE family protein phosphatase [Thermoguttaceae bacterium]MDW8039258.1 SpoIIE family protein phosphatase [Thermoguttaceae bacterium]
MAVLRVVKGLTPGQIFALERPSAVLGRHPDCDIVLDQKAVSRQHARILRIDGKHYIEDLRSRNGTFVNDQPVQGRRLLRDGDRVRICDMEFVFHEGSAEEAAMAWEQEEGLQTTAMLIGEEQPLLPSSVMSRVDVSTGPSSLRLTAHPELKLRALLQISQQVGKALGLSETLAKLLETLFTIFVQADRGVVLLLDGRTGRLVPKAFRTRQQPAEIPIRISRTIVQHVLETKQAVLSADAMTDARFKLSDSIVDFRIRSVMCAPMVGSSGQALGVIQIDTQDPRYRFSEEDLELLASVACQAAVLVENAQLQEIALQERVYERELAVAHEVQLGFLPSGRPQVPGYEFFDYYMPAKQIGGDYFDYVELSGGRVALLVADVSGKGVAAALLVARLSAEMRYCLAMEPDPAQALARLNRLFCEQRWEGRFVTCVLAILDPNRHELILLNAGHLPPLCRRANGEVSTLATEITQLPLGVECQTQYQKQLIALQPGDIVLCFTDGVTDAMNAGGQVYGRERLAKAVALAPPSVDSLIETIVEDLHRFVGPRPPTDDICMCCFARLAD